MHQTLSQALGTQWAMFYNPAITLDRLTPMQTLDHSVNFVNQYLEKHGRLFDKWEAGAQDELARLMWVNWIYQRLPVEPIRKPVLCHLDGGQLKVDCGDTRLMALKLFNSLATIGVVVVCDKSQITQFNTWQLIKHEQELISATGFSSNACVLFRTNHEHGLEWLEIGDQTTSHHLHNVDRRIEMIQNYINTQPADFRFSSAWAKSIVDWNKY